MSAPREIPAGLVESILAKLAGRRVVASVSGGKDSVALWLYLLRLGLEVIAVYIDTGWEWDGHHGHLDLLEARIGKIHRIAPPGGFAAATLRKGTFPSRVRKWCTEELKLKPFRAWLDKYRDESGEDVVVALGIRRDESASRSSAVEWEFADFYDADVWRPILDWTVADVAAEHHRAVIPLHPLYHHGAERVGCFPCVNASKAELEIVGRLAPERVERIRALEAEMGATMFTRDRRTEKARAGDDGPSVVPVGIDEVMAWARTARGGEQFQLLRPPSGCARWGVCEAPAKDDDGGAA